MKIGEFVRQYIEKIFEYCEENPEEFLQLQDKEYSKNTFGINYPFCMKESEISILHDRYWGEEYVVRGQCIRVTNDWYINNFAGFSLYILEKNLIAEAELLQFEKKLLGSPSCGVYAIARAQNALIRNILSKSGVPSFNDDDWRNTQEYFKNKCAYCASSDKLEMEHAIPINKNKLGEHHLGNVVPSCKDCNSKKSGQNYTEFISSDSKRIDIIKTYMDSRGYIPLVDNDQVKAELENAYHEVGGVAKKYIKIINELLSADNLKKDI